MPKALVFHTVDDVDHWLNSPKREEIFKGVLEDIETFVCLEDPNKVGLSANILDMEKFNNIMASEEGAAAMKHDGVHADTVQLFLKS